MEQLDMHGCDPGRPVRGLAGLLMLLCLSVGAADGAEIARLNATTWARVPTGHETDAIYGDWLLESDLLVAVVGATVDEPLRQGNTMTPDVRGALLELGTRAEGRDRLTALLPGGGIAAGCTYAEATAVQAAGSEVRLRVTHPPSAAEPYMVETDYVLADGKPFLTIVTRVRNAGDEAVQRSVADKLRIQGHLMQGPDAPEAATWVYERYMHAAYGVRCAESRITRELQEGGREQGVWLRYTDVASEGEATVQPGQEVAWTRRVFVGRDLFALKATWLALDGAAAHTADVTMVEAGGGPVSDVEVVARRDGQLVAAGAPDAHGRLRIVLPPGTYSLGVQGLARPPATVDVDLTADRAVRVALEPACGVEADIADAEGSAAPCKVQFRGVAPTPDPDLGPWFAIHALRNLYYSESGRFRQAVPSGTYDVIVSRGPEFDAAFERLTIEPGRWTRLSARLPRVLDTSGWIAADFHGHTTESGDNIVPVAARVLNLAAEGVEFANSSDHVRVVDWQPAIDALGLSAFLRTCLGEEISGPGAQMHHNAFPLPMRPHAQANGGIPAGGDLTAQTGRIAEWADGAEKLIILNHPDVDRYFYRESHPEAYRLINAVEAMGNPLSGERRNRCLAWLSLLNRGLRIVGVANTDSHAAVHGAGYQRNWVRSGTDDPASIDPLEVVRAVQAGHVVMSTGPFMEVTTSVPGGATAGPGDDLRAPDGRVALRIKVQCPNWFDVNRVQVLVNGRPEPQAGVTRESAPERFGDETVKFEGEVTVQLAADAHLVVVAAGEAGSLEPVMGRGPGQPCAVSNPVWVDVDGNGFEPNGDRIDA